MKLESLKLRWFALLVIASVHFCALGKEEVLQIGSKRFTESYILGEILTRTAMPHAPAQHRQGLGNTAIVLAALRSGNIDLYPEYLGTIEREILKHEKSVPLEQLQKELAALGLGMGVKLGFNNSYALAVRNTAPAELQTLSELARQPQLRLGLSHEFLGRADGWPGLAQRYKLPHKPGGLDHGIAFEALAAQQVDVIDVYSTDAKIGKLKLRVLQDDTSYFPRYDAVLLYRLDLPQRHPKAWVALQALEGKIDNPRMIALNASVEIEGQTFASVARQFVAANESITIPISPVNTSQPAAKKDNFWNTLFAPDFGRLTAQHMVLVGLSMLLAGLVGIPMGVLAAEVAVLRQPVMALVGMLQTVPSLALLAILIALMGQIGTAPALVALFFYALLPIVRTTCTGLLQIPRGLRMAAVALGLKRADQLMLIELPLALPFILAGLKTAAVMSVGTATLAAFVGAGGYGERISIGLALNDHNMLLAGALPAAALALLVQWLFDAFEKRLKKY